MSRYSDVGSTFAEARRIAFQVVQNLPAPESCVWISARRAFARCCGLVWQVSCPKCLLSCCPCWQRIIDSSDPDDYSLEVDVSSPLHALLLRWCADLKSPGRNLLTRVARSELNEIVTRFKCVLLLTCIRSETLYLENRTTNNLSNNINAL